MALKPDTKRIIFESFEKLLRTHSLEDITVQQILNDCGASRSAFYRHFKDKYDLMIWAYRKQLDQIINNLPELSSYQEVTYELMAFLKSKREYFANIAKAEVQNSFREFMYDYSLRYVLHHLKEALKSDELPREYILSAQASCAGITFITLEWLMRGCDISVSEFTQILCDSIPIKISPYFSQK